MIESMDHFRITIFVVIGLLLLIINTYAIVHMSSNDTIPKPVEICGKLRPHSCSEDQVCTFHGTNIFGRCRCKTGFNLNYKNKCEKVGSVQGRFRISNVIYCREDSDCPLFYQCMKLFNGPPQCYCREDMHFALYWYAERRICSPNLGCANGFFRCDRMATCARRTYNGIKISTCLCKRTDLVLHARNTLLRCVPERNDNCFRNKACEKGASCHISIKFNSSKCICDNEEGTILHRKNDNNEDKFRCIDGFFYSHMCHKGGGSKCHGKSNCYIKVKSDHRPFTSTHGKIVHDEEKSVCVCENEDEISIERLDTNNYFCMKETIASNNCHDSRVSCPPGSYCYIIPTIGEVPTRSYCHCEHELEYLFDYDGQLSCVVPVPSCEEDSECAEDELCMTSSDGIAKTCRKCLYNAHCLTAKKCTGETRGECPRNFACRMFLGDKRCYCPRGDLGWAGSCGPQDA